jgi:hypothetical protein
LGKRARNQGECSAAESGHKSVEIRVISCIEERFGAFLTIEKESGYIPRKQKSSKACTEQSCADNMGTTENVNTECPQ